MQQDSEMGQDDQSVRSSLLDTHHDAVGNKERPQQNGANFDIDASESNLRGRDAEYGDGVVVVGLAVEGLVVLKEATKSRECLKRVVWKGRKLERRFAGCSSVLATFNGSAT